MRLKPEWYTLLKLPDGRDGCIIKPTLIGALEIAAAKFISEDSNRHRS